MWIATGIKTYIPPYCDSNISQDPLNNFWLTIPEGVCLLMQTHYSEKSIAGVNIPTTVKATKIQTY